MLLRTVLVAVVALLVCAGSAQASSLVYIKDYNVWLANPDGSRQRQLTTDGFKELPYESPSQADNGTILAGRGLRFVKLDRQGNRIGPLLPSILVGKPDNAYAIGPFDPKISPDGRKLAYWAGTWSMWFDYGTNINWSDPKDAVIWQDASAARSSASRSSTRSPHGCRTVSMRCSTSPATAWRHRSSAALWAGATTT